MDNREDLIPCEETSIPIDFEDDEITPEMRAEVENSGGDDDE